MNREALMAVVVAAVLAGVGLTAAASAARAPGGRRALPLFPRDCTHEARRPTSVIVTCADANNSLGNLRWSRWGRHSAVGKGSDAVNDCTPDCASGHFHRYRARVKLTRPRRCPEGGFRQYTRLTLIYFAPKPSGARRRQSFPFPCPPPVAHPASVRAR